MQPEIGHRHRHQVKEAICERFTRRAERADLPGDSAVDDDVGGAHQVQEPPPVLVVSGIEDDAALVRVMQREGQAVTVDQRRSQSPGTTGGRFDLGDIGAQIRQQPRDLAGLPDRGVNDPQAGQRRAQCCHFVSFVISR